MLHYDHTDAKDFAMKDLGMQWDEDGAEMVDQAAYEMGLTQAQFTGALTLYAVRIKQLFSPSSYTFKGRVQLALHFLFRKTV